MADTSIEWADKVWNPVVGCTRVSAGCDHCYAIRVAARGMSAQHRGLTKLRPKDASRPGPDWTGEVRCLPQLLAVPLRWRKPQRVFVNSMSDLFHAQVPFEFIAAVFGVMAVANRHTFLVLTKRPERALAFFGWLDDHEYGAFGAMEDAMEDEGVCDGIALDRPWPLPNVHLGVSVEDQATANERVPVLLDCPAAVRWVSYEPALGPVDWTQWLAPGWPGRCTDGPRLDWIVVGGESGPGARPCDVAWIRSIVEQCRAAGVKAFVKQLGSAWASANGGDRKGGDLSRWPTDLAIRELPDVD